MKSAKVKRTVKVIVDVLMFCVMIYALWYHPGAGLRIHAYIGMSMVALFALHHALNRAFIRALPRGEYNARRRAVTILDALLTLVMLSLILGAFMVSGLAFPMTFLPTAFVWRNVHTISAGWLFFLSAVHTALHLEGRLAALERRVVRPATRTLLWALEGLLLLAGVFSLFASGIFSRMFNLFWEGGDIPLAAFAPECLAIALAATVAIRRIRAFAARGRKDRA